MLGKRKGLGQGPYYFTRGQLVLLAAGFTLASAVIFLLGILIGKGIEERKVLKKEEPLVKIPVQPAIPGSKTATPKEEMTFYDTLAKAQTAGKAKESKPVEKGTKPEVKEGSSSAKQTAPVPARDIKEKIASEKSPSVPETRKETPSEKEAAKRDANWTVQINSYQNEKDARALAKKLKDKGYDAYVATTKIKGRPWFRVRVGHLETREQAQALQESLKQKENLTQSIATNQ